MTPSCTLNKIKRSHGFGTQLQAFISFAAENSFVKYLFDKTLSVLTLQQLKSETIIQMGRGYSKINILTTLKVLHTNQKVKR